MKTLFFDTETTGLPKNFRAPYTDLDNWPRVVQLSWLVAEDGQVLKESDNIIKVDFLIPEQSSQVHGITNAVSEAKGRPLGQVLDEILQDISQADVLVCHNLSFDMAILQSELLRAGKAHEVNKRQFCTMKSSVDFCKLPGPYGFKWPKLEELYQICFQEKLENAHDAMVDVKATFRCFNKLAQDQVFQLS
jgi:DNA polymerase III epsilon subunit-like protein